MSEMCRHQAAVDQGEGDAVCLDCDAQWPMGTPTPAPRLTWHNPKWFRRALAPLIEYERGGMLSAKARKLLVRHPCLTVHEAINMAMTERDEYAKRESEAE